MATIEIEGLQQRKEQFEHMLSTDPEMRKRFSACVRKILNTVRQSLSKNADDGLNMKSDPRHAYKAVRSAVYKRILGGQVNILQSRRAGNKSSYEPPRTLDPKKRGGNRTKRSNRTQKMMEYEGKDRGFILRFLNSGTGDRAVHSMGDRNLRSGSISVRKTKSIGANRGSISARNWFGPRSHHELENASEQLQTLIDQVINGEFK